MLEPRHALPRRRPRICLRYLTFFGINIDLSCLAPSRASDLGQAQPVLRPRHALQLALVDPHLHADLPVGRAALGKPVVDAGPQRVQRQLTLEVPFGARDLGAAQPARHADFHALGAEAHGRLDRLFHGPAEGDATLHLQTHRLSDQLRLQLRLVDLHDVDEDLAAGLLLKVVAQLVHLGPLAADDDPGPRGVDVDLQLVGRALDVDARHARVRQPLLQLGPEPQILVQERWVGFFGVPARLPGAVEPEPEAERMDLLTHSVTSPGRPASRRFPAGALAPAPRRHGTGFRARRLSPGPLRLRLRGG